MVIIIPGQTGDLQMYLIRRQLWGTFGVEILATSPSPTNYIVGVQAGDRARVFGGAETRRNLRAWVRWATVVREADQHSRIRLAVR